jgi:hypothetical protein
MEKMGEKGEPSLFSKDTEENKKQITAFKRFCFIIYAGDRDEYKDYLGVFLEKVHRSFKNVPHPSSLILLLFALRIILLRLSKIYI